MGEIFTGNIKEGSLFATTSLFVWLPIAIGVDIYNVVIGLPSTAIVNPWINYQVQQQKGETCLLVQ